MSADHFAFGVLVLNCLHCIQALYTAGNALVELDVASLTRTSVFSIGGGTHLFNYLKFIYLNIHNLQLNSKCRNSSILIVSSICATKRFNTTLIL
jgi:hypothetical protein